MITSKFQEIRHLYNIRYDKIKYRIIQFCILQVHLQIKLDILIKTKLNFYFFYFFFSKTVSAVVAHDVTHIINL